MAVLDGVVDRFLGDPVKLAGGFRIRQVNVARRDDPGGNFEQVGDGGRQFLERSRVSPLNMTGNSPRARSRACWGGAGQLAHDLGGSRGFRHDF